MHDGIFPLKSCWPNIVTAGRCVKFPATWPQFHPTHHPFFEGLRLAFSSFTSPRVNGVNCVTFMCHQQPKIGRWIFHDKHVAFRAINIPSSCIWWYDGSMFFFMVGTALLFFFFFCFHICEIAQDIFEILCRNRRISKQTATRTTDKYKLRLRCRIIRNIQLLYISTLFQIRTSYLNFTLYNMDT